MQCQENWKLTSTSSENNNMAAQRQEGQQGGATAVPDYYSLSNDTLCSLFLNTPLRNISHESVYHPHCADIGLISVQPDI